MISPGLASAAELRIGHRERGGEAVRVLSTIFSRQGQRTELSVVLEPSGGRREAARRGERDGLQLERGRAMDPRQLAAIRWYLAEPEERAYDNFSFCKRRPDRCPQPIYYRLVELRELRGRTSFQIQEVPRIAGNASPRRSRAAPGCRAHVTDPAPRAAHHGVRGEDDQRRGAP